MSDVIVSVATPVAVLGAGVFFAVYLRGLPFAQPRAGARAILHSGGARQSPVRSMLLALAGTLGVGNIVGVASAIALGGAGAVFWMWVSAFAAMFLKYAEVVLAVVFREKDKDGRNRGGAPYYIRACLGRRWPALGRVAAALFAALCLGNALLMGCMIQSSAVAGAMEKSFGVPPLVCGVALAVLCFILLKRGKGAIGAVTSVLVPLMSILFVVVSLAILIARRGDILPALAAIIKGAFTVEGAAGGFLGFFLSRALRYGTIRGIISNEAGCGTSPTAHAASDAQSPVEQGLFGVVEVFVDTIVLCTVTALVILVHQGPLPDNDPMAATLTAYSAAFGGSFAVEAALAAAILCFGFATMLCWAHYGCEAVQFLFPHARSAQNIVIPLFCLFAILGAVAAPSLAWSLTDLITGTMTLINISVLLLARRQIRQKTFEYYKT